MHWLEAGKAFDGVDDKVVIGNSDQLNFSGEITLSAWVKIDTTGGIKTILGHGPSGGKEVYLRLNGNSYQFGSWDSATNNHLVSAPIPAEDIGAWVHLVGTYDGVNWNLYKNGELLASRADTVGCVPLTTNWYVGSSNGNARFFDGEIREVAIWDSALNAAQAAAVYAGTAPSEDYATSVTSYTYDALNRLTSLTDPVGNTTSYTYNYMGLVLTETNEKNATRYYSYDSLGRLVQKTDRNDRVTTYTYDSLGRLTSEHWGDTADYFMYTYDLVGNLLYATDGDHSYSYTYDALYRPIYTSFNFDSQSAVFSYTYDAVGRQTSSSLTLNGHANRVNTTTYDYLGNATSIRQHGNITDEIFAEFDYNTNGLLTSVRRYEKDDDTINEIANSLYEYNANSAVTSITHNDSNGSQIVKHSYTYDETNNIVEYLNSIDGNTEYNYDFLGQLISADYANQTDESYTYDANGNRIVANGSNYTTGDNNELTSDGNYTYTYDAEGNRISKTNTANTERELYTWDHRNRLTSVTKQTYDTETQTWETVQIVEYTYDYNNIWIRKVIGDSKTIFIPENYQTTVQIDNGATTTHHYLWTPNAQDKLLADTTSDGVLWSLADHLGTIRDILGTASTHLIYDAFGNLISGTNPLLFGYTGKAFDTDTNLQNNINRWYDSTVGRWLSTDPIGFNGNDANLYRYVHNRSMNFIDFSGLIKEIFIEPTPWLDGEAAMRVEYDENDCGYIMLTINGEQKWRYEFNGNLVVGNYKFDYGWLRKDSGYVEIEVGQKDGSAKIYRKNYETQYHDLLSYDNKFTYIPVENAGVSNIMLSLSGIYRQIWSHERTDFIFHWFPVAAEWRTPISITVNLFAGREAGDSRIAISYPSSNAFGDMNIVGPASSFREIPSISGTGPRGNVHNYTSAVSLTYLNNLEKWFKPLTRAEETGDKFRFAILSYVTTGHGLGLGIPKKFSFQLPGTTRKQ